MNEPTKWIASQYMDDDRWGILTMNNEIVVGVSSRLTKSDAEGIARDHNEFASLRASLVEKEGELQRAQQALLNSDAMLSLLRHRHENTIKWGTQGIPELRDVDKVIGESRKVLGGK